MWLMTRYSSTRRLPVGAPGLPSPKLPDGPFARRESSVQRICAVVRLNSSISSDLRAQALGPDRERFERIRRYSGVTVSSLSVCRLGMNRKESGCDVPHTTSIPHRNHEERINQPLVLCLAQLRAREIPMLEVTCAWPH